MLTKQTLIGSITIQSDGRMAIRDDTVIFDDGVEVARTYHRRVLDPGTDVSAETDMRLPVVAAAVWTPEVVTAFVADQAKQLKADKKAVV